MATHDGGDGSIVDRVVSAYRRTGVIPRRNLWWTTNRARQTYACGLGVLVLDSGRNVYKDISAIAHALGVSLSYARGFATGFDGGRFAPGSSTEDYENGHRDGVATYAATRRWRARETIRLGLEALGDACAAAAARHEQRVVTQGIAAMRRLVQRRRAHVDV